jgi:hypothetical protein
MRRFVQVEIRRGAVIVLAVEGPHVESGIGHGAALETVGELAQAPAGAGAILGARAGNGRVQVVAGQARGKLASVRSSPGPGRRDWL